ncbi:PKD domain-containing protein [Massilia sp. PAMC28688]|uniref:PKD domain-containing protein n=1 Tax=Massilia sp. PAMC28688 TaxID=2861283 RepID=UPI001C627BD1|nr:PKD domain-containing protein [Massilia sp. PAMC28688]QYF95010.1 PKD domain-containing protein [Massilia sp. PAMC28688]
MSLALMLAAITAASLMPASAVAQSHKNYDGSPVRVKPAFPVLNLGSASHGQEALSRLGGRLPQVAAYYGKTPAEFARQMREDKSTRLDKHGRLFHMEEPAGPPPPGYFDEALVKASGDTAQVNAVYGFDQTFSLHSRPFSKRKIYLDFNGHTVTGTAWNSAYGTDPIIAVPYDTDGVPGTFSAAELTAIQNIWRRVSEDFAAFDVDVTTQEPAADLMTRSSGADDTFGTRALITRNFTAALGGDCGCGGFAYVGVFDNVGNYHKPAFVFYDMLGGEKNIAEATSHEVGHNLGLGHDGAAGTGYYGGHGSLDTGWAPIMGVGYYRWLVQFSKGEYAGANNQEDDYAVMASNGVLVAPDDFGNTKASAAVLAPTLENGINVHDAQGVINSPTDIDSFKLHAGAGTINIDARPFNKSPNADLLVLVRDAAHAIVASANPADFLNGVISLNRPAGTYWVSVQGTGKGDPATTGYSSYGSLGRYSLRVTAPVPTASGIPQAIVSASATSATASATITFSGTASNGAITVYEWNFADGSPVVYGASASHAYTAPGTYNASLRVTTSAGYSDIRALQIIIR